MGLVAPFEQHVCGPNYSSYRNWTCARCMVLLYYENVYFYTGCFQKKWYFWICLIEQHKDCFLTIYNIKQMKTSFSGTLLFVHGIFFLVDIQIWIDFCVQTWHEMVTSKKNTSLPGLKILSIISICCICLFVGIWLIDLNIDPTLYYFCLYTLGCPNRIARMPVQYNYLIPLFFSILVTTGGRL